MKILKFISLIGYILLSFDIAANQKFFGQISGQVVEDNNHTFAFNFADENFTDGFVENFRQTSGQPIVLSNKQLKIKTLGYSRYQIAFEVVKLEGELFQATFNLSVNSPQLGDDGQPQLTTQIVQQGEVQGQLNVLNEYQYVLPDQPNFYLKINIDRFFTAAEVKARMQQKILNRVELE